MPRSMYGNSSFGMYGGMSMGGMGMAPQYVQQSQFAPVQDKGKGRAAHVDSAASTAAADVGAAARDAPLFAVFPSRPVDGLETTRSIVIGKKESG